MYYPSAKFGVDMSSGFCVTVHTYLTHTHTHIADKRPCHAVDYVGVTLSRYIHSFFQVHLLYLLIFCLDPSER